MPEAVTLWSHDEPNSPAGTASNPLIVSVVSGGGGGGGGGDASAVNQTVGNNLLTSIDGKTPNLGQALAGASVPVVLTAAQVAALTPIPAITGFATAANQATENNALASLDSKTPALGQALAANATPVVLTAAQVATLTPPAPITGYSTAANQTTELASLASIDTKTPALGQALAAASSPVVLPAAQITALTPPAAITGFATAANQATELASIGAPADAAATTDTGTFSLIALFKRFLTQIAALFGSLTETAPATDIASSGLNGRLQRVSQRITALIALMPTALTTLGNFKVSVQEQIIRTYTKTATTTSTSGDQTLVAAPSAGNHLVVKDMIVQNESAVETTIILKNGASAEWRAKLAANASFTLSFAEGEEWRLNSATPLVLNLSGANVHGYSLRYRIEGD